MNYVTVMMKSVVFLEEQLGSHGLVVAEAHLVLVVLPSLEHGDLNKAVVKKVWTRCGYLTSNNRVHIVLL